MSRHYARRVDRNQKDIVAALRRVGSSVVLLSSRGDGIPDLLVGRGRVTYLLEVKRPGTLTGGESMARTAERQAGFREAWRGGPVAVVRSVDEALAVVLSEAHELPR